MKLTIDFGCECNYVQFYYANGDGKLQSMERMKTLVLFVDSFCVYVPSCQILCANGVRLNRIYETQLYFFVTSMHMFFLFYPFGYYRT